MSEKTTDISQSPVARRDFLIRVESGSTAYRLRGSELWGATTAGPCLTRATGNIVNGLPVAFPASSLPPKSPEWRLTRSRPPFSVARTLLEAHPAARRLVHDWRILRFHNSCQFSAEAENIRPDTQLASNLTQLALRVTHAHACVQHIDKVRKSRLTIFGRVPIILRRDMSLQPNSGNGVSLLSIKDNRPVSGAVPFGYA